MEPVYDVVLKALLKDAEAHGDNKKISAYIALLEENQLSPERGQTLLRYVTCTTDDAPYVLNQILYRDMKGVSFAAVEEEKPIHVPRVQLHGNIHFWNQDRPAEQRRGSFLVLPLQDAHWRVFGTLGLDTLRDPSEKTIFLTHEISFYQGVSHAFSKAYHHVCALGSVLQMALTALDWLYHRVPSIHTVSTYLVEPGNDQTCDYALRRMATTDSTGQKEIHTSPVLLLRKENLFRDYLFKCTDDGGHGGRAGAGAVAAAARGRRGGAGRARERRPQQSTTSGHHRAVGLCLRRAVRRPPPHRAVPRRVPPLVLQPPTPPMSALHLRRLPREPQQLPRQGGVSAALRGG